MDGSSDFSKIQKSYQFSYFFPNIPTFLSYLEDSDKKKRDTARAMNEMAHFYESGSSTASDMKISNEETCARTRAMQELAKFYPNTSFSDIMKLPHPEAHDVIKALVEMDKSNGKKWDWNQRPETS